MCFIETNLLTRLSICSLVLGTVLTFVSAQDEMDYCPDLHPPMNFKKSEVLGLFYAIEIVQHKDEARHRGISTVDSCPMVHLSNAYGSNSMIKLLWNEQAGHVEYLFTILNQDNPGFWMSSGPQNGSMLQRPYKQFAGTVQVMRVTSNYVVLTFCSPNSENYSVLLSRNKRLAYSEISAVHDMLIKKNLKQVGIREACRDSAVSISASAVLIMTAIMATFI